MYPTVLSNEWKGDRCLSLPTNKHFVNLCEVVRQDDSKKASLFQDIRPIAVDTLKCHLPNLPSRSWYRFPLGQRALADPQPTPGVTWLRFLPDLEALTTIHPHPLSSTHYPFIFRYLDI